MQPNLNENDLKQNTMPHPMDEKKQKDKPDLVLKNILTLFDSLKSKFYKTLLKIISWKAEISHLVILLASLGLLYRGLFFIDHLSTINFKDVSLVSPAQAEIAPPKENKDESTKNTTEPKKETSKEELDPLLLDENQIKVLLALAKKEKNINETEQEADIGKQKKIVELAQENLNKRISELEKVKKGIDSKKDELNQDEKKNLQNIAKLYETMKPTQAAEIFNQLELTSLTQIIKHMNQKKAAPIVAAMDQKKARLLTIEIIRSKDAEEKKEAGNPPPIPEQPTLNPAAAAQNPAAPGATPASETKDPKMQPPNSNKT